MFRTRSRAEDGYTIIEIMIVLLVMGVLIAIAIPTWVAARTRADDRAAQSDLRNAITAERAYYADKLTYTSIPAQMTALESSLAYQDGDTPSTQGLVYLHLHPIPKEIFVSTRSVSGTCYYLREADGGGTRYASSPGCGVADTQTYSGSW
jgi:type IV pilus assembly protein PilA